MAETAYSVDRARTNIAGSGTAPGPADTAAPPPAYAYTTHPRLADTLRHLPDQTVAVLFFVPFALPYQGEPDSASRRYWDECKRRVVALSRPHRNVRVVDFMRDSPITQDPANYYDAIHYRPHIADRLARHLAQTATQGEVDSQDAALLEAPPEPDTIPFGL